MQDYFTSSIEYFRNRFVKLNVAVSALGNIGLWLWLLFWLRQVSDAVPLHYNIYFGIDRFGPRYYILLMPAVGLVFFLVNTVVGLVVYNREKLLSYFLVAATTVCHVILGIAAFFILYINA